MRCCVGRRIRKWWEMTISFFHFLFQFASLTSSDHVGIFAFILLLLLSLLWSVPIIDHLYFLLICFDDFKWSSSVCSCGDQFPRVVGNFLFNHHVVFSLSPSKFTLSLWFVSSTFTKTQCLPFVDKILSHLSGDIKSV